MAEAFPKDILLRVGGAVLARHGIAAVAGSRRGSVEVPITMARADASTCATTIDRDGIVRLAAANVLRVQWEDLDGDGIRETPGLLLEGSRQNTILRSEEIDNVAWSKTTVTFGVNADVAPDGTTTADRLIEGALTQEHVVYQTLAGTSNTAHSLTVFAKAGTRSWLTLTIRDVVGGTNRVQASFNLTTGVVGTVNHNGAGSGEQAFIEKLANGWYRCKLVGACNNADTTPIPTIAVANADNTTSYAGDGASYISLWGAQFEQDKAFPSSYIKTVASAVTRAADSFTTPFNFGTLDCTTLVRLARPVWADASGTIGMFPGLATIGGATPRLRMFGASASRALHADIFDGASNPSVNQSIPAGASLTVCARHRTLTTGGKANIDVGSGFSADSATAAAFAAFGNQTLVVGSLGSGSELYGVLLDLKILRGLFTLAEALAVP